MIINCGLRASAWGAVMGVGKVHMNIKGYEEHYYDKLLEKLKI